MIVFILSDHDKQMINDLKHRKPDIKKGVPNAFITKLYLYLNLIFDTLTGFGAIKLVISF